MAQNPNDIHWYPLRVAYHHEFRIRDELNRLKVEYYLPVKWEQRTYGGHLRQTLVPLLNIIFVHSSQEEITKMKMCNKEMSYLRYIIDTHQDENTDSDILIVPDCQMNSFMIATRDAADSRLEYLRYTDFLEKEGRNIRVVNGDFTGVEGKIKRIHKNRCVVVCLRGIAAVSLQIPFEHLEFIK